MKFKIVFPTEKAALARHAKIHSEIRFPCEYCEKSCVTKTALRDHLQTHGVIPRTKVCSFPNCGRAFYKKSDVTRHEKEVHLGLRKKKNTQLKLE